MIPSPQEIPDFVIREIAGSRLGVPLLMFHWLRPEDLEHYLQFLADGGYRTLTADQVAAVARGEADRPEKAVALTFDDGVYNNWAVVAPLLARYGQRGIAFIAPALLGDGPVRPTLSDVDAGKLPMSELLDDEAAGRYMTWDEVVSLDAGGVLEIQSHTYDHALVFTSDRIIDFQHPLANGRPRYPWLWTAVGAAPHEPLWGAPVYPTAPRLFARRYHNDPSLRETCRRFVDVRGGLGYFADVTWRQELERFANLETRGRRLGHLETTKEMHIERMETLARPRAVLGEALAHDVDHIALPWSRGASDAPKLIEAAGYRSGYTREVVSERLGRASDPFDLARVEGYWLESLPAPDRVTLAGRLKRSLRRRLGA